MKIIASILVGALLIGCAKKENEDAPIGSARMEANGTIIMDLVAESGSATGHARFTYSPNDEKYQEIINHLGGLKPGEEKLVPPWKNE